MIDPGARIEPRQLQVLGTGAALLYCDQGIPLSEAVYKVTQKVNLTTHHVRRILEIANVKAYLQQYERKAPMGSDGNWSKYVSFPEGPALFEDVMGMLDATPVQEVKVAETRDYDNEPESYKVAHYVENLDLPELEKVAWDENSSEEMPKVSLDSLYSSLGTAISKLDHEIILLNNKEAEACSDFMRMAKQAVLEDYSLGDIRKVASLSPSTHLDRALNKLAHAMKSVFWTDDQIMGSFEKVSAKQPAPSHPLTVKYAQWTEAAEQLDTAQRTKGVLERNQKLALAALREVRNG